MASAAAGDRRRGRRQDGDARPSPRPSRARRRRPQAHHAGDLLAPRRRRAQPPRPAHPRPPPRPRGRRGGDAELQRHLPFDRRAAVARIRDAHRPRSRLHHPRPRGFGRPDGAVPPRGGPVAEGRALPDQGDLPGDLFARRQRADSARRGARPPLSLGGGARSGAARPVRRLCRDQAAPARARLRRPAALFRPDARRAGARRGSRGALRPSAGRRIPGHQPPAGRDRAEAQARGARPDRGRRRRAVDLFVPRRDGAQHPRISRSASRRRRASSRSSAIIARPSRSSPPPTR